MDVQQALEELKPKSVLIDERRNESLILQAHLGMLT